MTVDPTTRAARGWAAATIVTQVLFVVAVSVAPIWQPSGYSSARHTISDMYAAGSPGAWVLITILVAGGLSVAGFAMRSLWPALRSAGWVGFVGAVLLALSNYGLPGVLAPWDRLPCNSALPTCGATLEAESGQAAWHGVIAAVALLFVVASAAVLAVAMRRVPRWRATAVPSALFAVGFFALAVLSGFAASAGLGGLAERVLAFSGALAIAALAAFTASASGRGGPHRR